MSAESTPGSPPPLIAALLDPRRYPHPVQSVELLETHISWVLLAGECAYKIKKPVSLGFLDFSTLEARRTYCDEELRLNRRTAPGLYLDVVSVTGSLSAPVLGGTGPPIEHVLRMRRFAQDALLDRMVRTGGMDSGLADRLAAAVARFHDRIPVASAGSAHGSAAEIARMARENFDQSEPLVPPGVDTAAIARLRAWTVSESTRLAPAFARRQASGRVRECHGDLHLGNIAMIDGEPVPFDCIEFSAELRWIDVMNEIAFVVMDLLDCGQARLAWRWLNRYLEISGDYEGIEVLRYYLVYRAMVRAKVALIRARQATQERARRDAEEAFSRHLHLADRLTVPDAAAALMLMHGVSGSGKTTLSQALLEDLAAVRVRSDVERKRLHGLAAQAASGSAVGTGLYDAAASRRTYERLGDVAELAVSSGWRVVVDAASLQHSARERFRTIARARGVPFVLISCEAPAATLRARVAQRRAVASDASEATAGVLERQLAEQEPLRADELREAVIIDNSAGPAVPGIVAQIMAQVSAQLAAGLNPGRAHSHGHPPAKNG